MTIAGGTIGGGPRAADAGTWEGSGVATQIWVLALRSLRALVLDPRILVSSLLAPFLMLLVFSQIFAGIANTPQFPAGVGYTDFLVPAIMVNTAMQSAMQTGIGLTQETQNGIIARLRSLPIWPGSILVGRSIAELIRSLLRLVVLLASALLIFGFRPAGGAGGVLAGIGLAALLGWGLGWIFIALTCWLREVELIQNVSGILLFPLMFASNAFVPVEALPRWLQVVAVINPMTHGIDAVRDLTHRGDAGGSAAVAVATALAVAVVAGFTAVKGLERDS
ncbi:ABC transporter permease [Actinomadura rudentiformis]|uniref:Transport permease protein n=1 Tax=Actinomadura rudentiformis TaxID=359158 RepID=A0A6H9YUZ9_9ACTN|nr:ABC transporter permease [Actinomadura rudentiformis]KAB2352447.1 ABC transporter permease [Actinomadura rudentiformis]